MLDQILAAEREERLQLFRQLYDRSREQRGGEDEQTRMLLELISQAEEPPPPMARTTSALRSPSIPGRVLSHHSGRLRMQAP
jgi:hypothetical protein